LSLAAGDYCFSFTSAKEVSGGPLVY